MSPLNMFLNLSTLRTELGKKIKNTAISNDRKDRWLNMAQDDLASEMDFDHLIYTTTFASVASQKKYYLENEFNKIMAVVDETGDQSLTELTESEMEDLDPDRGDTGVPFVYSLFGYEWVGGTLAASGAISIVSSSASDTTQKVRIRGTVSGVDDTELLTLNGTTTATGTKTFSNVYSIVKDTTTTGRVTVSSGTTTLGVFSPADLDLPRQPLYLYPTPSDIRTYRVRGIRRPKRLINTEDFPDFPGAYHELVLVGAAIRGHMDLFRPTIAASVRQLEYEPMLAKFKKQAGNKRGRSSPVIRSSIPMKVKPGRLPPEYGDY